MSPTYSKPKFAIYRVVVVRGQSGKILDVKLRDREVLYWVAFDHGTKSWVSESLLLDQGNDVLTKPQ